jgi:Isopenicillin N synthase and related dioxygenases
MQHVLSESSIPKQLWQRASGGYSSGGGTAFLNFVHYDTQHSYWGLRPHTDYGFVTILDATAPGLQVAIDGVFVDVPVRSGYLAVHFGEALRYITAYGRRQATAVRHRVLSQRGCDPIRHGIVYFANPDLDGMVCQFDAHGHERGSSSVVSLFERLERDLTELCQKMESANHDYPIVADAYGANTPS